MLCDEQVVLVILFVIVIDLSFGRGVDREIAGGSVVLALDVRMDFGEQEGYC